MTAKKTARTYAPRKGSEADNARRLNLRLSSGKLVGDIRYCAAAYAETPSQFVERWMSLVIKGKHHFSRALVDAEAASKQQEIKDYISSVVTSPHDPVDIAETRLTRLLAMALGTTHPALADLALLVMRSRELAKQELLKSTDKVVVSTDVTGMKGILANANLSKGGIVTGRKLDVIGARIGTGLNFGQTNTEVITGMDTPTNVARMATAEEADAIHDAINNLQSTSKVEEADKGWTYGALTTPDEDRDIIDEEDMPENPLSLLREVSDHFTGNDDLPNDLLPRIDKALERGYSVVNGEKYAALLGKASVRDFIARIVKEERPDLMKQGIPITSIVLAALRGNGALTGTPRERRIMPDESLEARFHQALVRTARFDRKQQGYIMGAYRAGVVEYVQATKPEVRPVIEYVHRVTGNRYAVIGQGRIQSNTPLDDMARVMIYRGRDGELWARPMHEWSMKFVRADAVTPASINPSRDAIKVEEADRPETIGEGIAQGALPASLTAEETPSAWEPNGKDDPKPAREATTFERDAQAGADGFDSILLNKRLCVVLPDSLDAREGDRLLFREVGLNGYTGRNIERFITHTAGLRLGGTIVSFIDAKSKRDREAPDTDRLLRELLAVMHRDGGHYTAKHGLYRSTADAIARLTADRVILDGKRLRPFTEMWEAYAKKHGMLYGRDAQENVRVGYNMVEEFIQEAYWTVPVHHPNVRERTIFKHLGFILATADETEFMAWGDSGPEWVTDRAKALRFARREDAELVASESEKAWKIKPFEDIEEFRQQLGEKLSEILGEMDESKSMDWFDSRNVDIVLDAILPTITGDLQP